MSPNQVIPPAARPLTPVAIALVVMLCVSWGFNQIAVKLALPDIPPMLQGTVRSALALPVLLLIAWLRGVKLFERDGTLGAGLFAGLLFGFEFVLIYGGLQLTSATRAVVFLYTAPFFVALGSYQFLGERLSAVQWGGLGLSFAGVAVAIGVPQPDVDAHVLIGDLMIVGGGDHDRREGPQPAFRRARKDLGLSGRVVDPDSGAVGLAVGRKLDAGSRA